MKKLLLLLCFVTTPVLSNSYCAKNPIYCRIKTVAPWIKSKKAMEISNIFHKLSKKYKTNPFHSIAIARHETTFGRSDGRKESIIVFNKEMTEWKHYRGYSDICLFQFHADTIIHEKLNPIKLKMNLEYCAEQHFKLLTKKIKVCKKMKVKKNERWACWHSYTPSVRRRYKKLVEEYL